MSESIIAEHINNQYVIKIKGLIQDIDSQLDTGAMFTVISYEALTGLFTYVPDSREMREKLGSSGLRDISTNKQDKEIFVSKLESLLNRRENNEHFRTFTSASGAVISGVPVRVDSVSFGDKRFEVPFYYYLITDCNKQSALLGDDFISCCDLTKTVESDIQITFHSDLYSETHQGLNYVTEKEIEIILEETIGVYGKHNFTNGVINYLSSETVNFTETQSETDGFTPQELAANDIYNDLKDN